MRLWAPNWLRMRMSELNVGYGRPAFGSDADWPVERRDGNFERFRPFSKFNVLNYEYKSTAHIDKYGGRVTKSAVGEMSSKVVPFFGDSFTFGIGVEDNETFASILSEKLDYFILNLGIPGSALHNQLYILSVRHAELGYPDTYIFFFFMGNDFADLIQHYLAGVGQKDQANTARVSVSSSRFFRQINDFVYYSPVFKRSYLIQFVKAKILAILNKGVLKAADPVFLLMQPDEEYRGLARESLRKELNRLVGLSEKLRFRVLFVLIPDRYQVNDKLRTMKEQYYEVDGSKLDRLFPNKLIEWELARIGIAWVDPTECIRGENVAGLYYVQDGHFTPKGHQVFADCISEELADWLESGKKNEGKYPGILGKTVTILR